MKKIFLTLIALSVCLMLSVSAFASDEVTITVGNSTIAHSNENVSVDIPLTISGNTGLLGLEFTISYDEGLTLTGMKEGSALSGLTFQIPGNLVSPVKVPFDGKEADVSNGEFLILTFSVPANDAKEYSISVNAESLVAYDDNYEDVDIAFVSGKITVEEEIGEDPSLPDVPTVPEVTPVTNIYNKPYTYVNESGVEETVASGVTFARAEEKIGDYTLKEFGMLFTKDNIDLNSFVIGAKNIKKAEGKAIGQTGRHYGILFYGPGVKYGVTYYTLPYAIYEDLLGNKVTVYGNNITNFTPEM